MRNTAKIMRRLKMNKRENGRISLPQELVVSSNVLFTQVALQSLLKESVTQNLLFSDTARSALIIENVSQGLLFTHGADFVRPPLIVRDVTQNLIFSDNLSASHSFTVDQDLIFNQAAALNIDLDLNISEDLIFTDAAAQSRELPESVSQDSIFTDSVFEQYIPLDDEVVSTFSVEFDNTNDYIDLPLQAYIQRAGPNTISWWEKVKSGSGTYPSRFRLACDSGNSIGIIRSSDVTNYAALTIFDGASGSEFPKRFADAPTLADSVDVWRHFCLIMKEGPDSGISADYVLYVDGVAYEAGPATGAGYASHDECRIGYDGVDSPANCLMDDIRIYWVELTESQVLDLYNNTGQHAELLEFYWPLEDGSGTTASEEIANADGTLTDGPTWSSDVPATL